MTWPIVESPLGGFLGTTTLSVYRLDPTGTVPIEPIPDLVPGVFTPFRVTVDIVDSEQLISECDVTQHPVQDFLDVVSHVHKRLEVLTVSGTLGAALKSLPFDGPVPPGAFARLDLLRIRNLRRIQDSRAPVMVVTPRNALARAFIASVNPQWGSSDGEQTIVTMTFVEARMVSPLLGAEVAPDYPAQEAGNNAASGGGQAPTATADGGATASPTPGVAPFSSASIPAP
jgi:hypothetical protein